MSAAESITERLANLSIPTVLITMAVLFLIRYILLRRKTPLTKSIAEMAESLAVAMGLVFLLIRPFIVQAFFIPSESMLPRLKVHDHLLVNKFIYRFQEPKLGDVIVFRAPIEATPPVMDEINRDADQRGLTGEARDKYIARQVKRREKDFIKRVIGVPGDTVRVTAGYVTIGGDRYNHQELRGMLCSSVSDGWVKLADGKVLVNGQAVTKEEVAAAAGRSGEDVKVMPGQVYVNGKKIKEPYIAEDPDGPYPQPDPKGSYPTPHKWLESNKNGDYVVKIPKGRLLVMGDNRNESFDARFWGLLDRRRVLGKAMFIFWPLNRISWVR